MQGKYSLTASFVICTFVYLIACTVAGAFLFFYTGNLSPLWLALIADVIATVVVYASSLIFKNSSLYDPYWSVIPPFIAWYWFSVNQTAGTISLALMVSISVWAIRLTLNWARGWHGLVHEDWRYVMLRNKNPKLYWLTNFGGIHMFPTLMVFAGMVPVYYASTLATQLKCYTYSPVVLGLGVAIALVATIIELLADEQMRSFKKRAKPGEFINEGIWRYSRHPNYFGEILFWFGLWVIQLSLRPHIWFTAFGWVAMLVMFLFASIPMMEVKNLKSKPGYAEYVKQVSVLIPWFRKGS
ncbi:MAG TPA: DUF1295 domain-containing protein [Chitinophagales bacterium]|nr:DUF1295 domain-containing protein [Chitinophagales bacterium]